MTTATAELRAAARRLRDNQNCEGFRVDCNSRELLDMIRTLLRAREPLILWLEDSAIVHLPAGECGYCNGGRNRLNLPCPPLAVARAINAAGEPSPGQDGHIADRLSGRSLYEQISGGEAP